MLLQDSKMLLLVELLPIAFNNDYWRATLTVTCTRFCQFISIYSNKTFVQSWIRLQVDASSPNARSDYKHWLRTFQNYLTAVPGDNVNGLNVLINFVSATVYYYIEDAATLDGAFEILLRIYAKPENEIFT